jgi:nucleotidyltransferase substrate binding protein (TIGR01987 family)
MSFQEDIRWQQRLVNLKSALQQLGEATALTRQRSLSRLEQQGLIKAFEFSHELSWNVMKDYAHFQGHAEIAGSRDATREALKMGLISDGDPWMEMIKSRNLTSHTYNLSLAQEIAEKIVRLYFPQMVEFLNKMERLQE